MEELTISQNQAVGGELKVNLHVGNIGDYTLDDYDFSVEFSCSPRKSIVLTKKDGIRKDSNNYIFWVDTNKTGAGFVKGKVTLHVPDTDAPDKVHTIVRNIPTRIEVDD